MTRIKLCGLSRPCDVEAANALQPDYIGFVFAPNSRRVVSCEQAQALKRLLSPQIRAVGVFVRQDLETIVSLARRGIIDVVQLHGNEPEDVVRRLRERMDKPIIQAFCIDSERDVEAAQGSTADLLLLDSGSGTGKRFDWKQIRNIQRPYFLAGGLDPQNVGVAVRLLRPYGVDVSSGIETGGRKDREKMAAFVDAVRKEDMQ